MSNHEERLVVDSLNVLMGFSRTKDGQSHKTIRMVEKHPETDLEVFKAKLSVIGGIWRIHRTVNARDVHKARKVLLHMLINYPEKASYIDSLWRTCLLQSSCIYGDKKFMFDVDTSDINDINTILTKIPNEFIYEVVVTPSGGRHIITKPFDTREVLKLGDVTLIRDGYVYVCSVGDEKS